MDGPRWATAVSPLRLLGPLIPRDGHRRRQQITIIVTTPTETHKHPELEAPSTHLDVVTLENPRRILTGYTRQEVWVAES